jgi:signal transduction histidine kinase
MKQFLYNFWNQFENRSTLETDSPSERRKKTTLVIIAILCCITGLISIAQTIINSRPIFERLMPLSFTTVVGAAVILYIYTKRFAILLYPFLVMILIIPIFFQISIGGFSAQGTVPIIFWSFLAPIGSLMFQDSRKATWWFVAYLVLFLTILSLDPYFTRFSELPVSFSEIAITHTNLMVSYAITIMLLSITIFFSMRYYVNAFQREHTRAEKLVMDLTDSNHQLEVTLKELQETQSELVQSEKMASLGKLAAGIAHEINNPMGALKSTASTSEQCVSKIEQFIAEHQALADIKDESRFKNLLQILKDNSQVFSEVSHRISNTVDSFINFARLDMAGFDKFDIHQGIDNTLRLIQHEIKARTEVVKEFGDIPPIPCYPGELNQVFMHLLTNAAQAIEEKGSITIQTYLEGEKVHILIQDSGVGIPPEKIESLFDPDFTKNGSRVKAGLGLFTSYNIINKHKGQIKVQSDVGKGTTFTIILPLDLEDSVNKS